MRYSKLVDLYERLEKTTKKLEKRDIMAEFYKSCSADELYRVVHLSMGAVPSIEEIGVAEEMVRRIIERTYGASSDEVVQKFKSTGDLGDAAAWFAEHRRIKPLAKKELTIDLVFDNLMKLPGITGAGSQERKVALVAELLAAAESAEACYIVRTVLGQMRIGVSHGIVRDAIASAFGREPAEIEHVANVVIDFGRVAEMAKAGRLKAEVALFRPLRVMLAERAPDLESALKAFDEPACETKLDGFRAQIHKRGNEVMIFSRRLEDVTNQFPDVVGWAKEALQAKECIVEGEILAVDMKTREPRPFQQLSRRIRRKHEIEEMEKQIPVRIDLFELLWLNGESLMKQPLVERWAALQKVVEPIKGKFQLVDHIETKNLGEADKFYHAALAIGEEGVIVKNMEAHYQPGRRVGFWLKVKPIMEPLDLVVIGAEWGRGKRTRWLGSLILGARDPRTKKFIATGMMGSGLTDEQFEVLTKELKKHIVAEKGRVVEVKPQTVVEIAYEEIQRSPKYPTGFALRFPRLLRIRDPEDKGPEDANTTHDIERLFKQQKRFKK
jgi:DNA ligase-1